MPGRGREPLLAGVRGAREHGEREDDGWLLVLAYDGRRDRTFVEVRDAGTLDVAARVFAPTHLPLGFHGSFVEDTLVLRPS